jgi:uncharacterized SAM-binding protein YcdF (DUF218 family)
VFFYLSKIFWFVTAPLNLLFLLLAVGGLLFWKAHRAEKLFLIPGILLFLICGVSPAGYDLLVWLEAHDPPPKTRPGHVDGVVILGGSFYSDVTAARNLPALNDNGERVLAAVQLGKLYPDAKIVFSGGNGMITGDRTRPESDDARLFMKTYAFDESHVIYEERSRNTYENIKFSRALAQPKPGETWLLVTSAYHMPRAMMVAKSAGWDMRPWPVDFRTTGEYTVWPHKIDVLGNFYATQVAWHELLGMWVYRLTGRAA